MTTPETEDHHLQRFLRLPKPVRLIYARPRTFIALAVGLIMFFMLPDSIRVVTRLLLAWDACIALYLLMVYTTAFRTGLPHIMRVAALQDDGRFLMLLLTGLGAFASLAAIVAELGLAGRGAPQLILAMVTIALSWATIHSTFALHYAHEYYRDGKGSGLKFPGDEPPDYWDFVYFAFVIGISAEVSDVSVTSKVIRRTVTAHGIASFLFNTALLALTVNIAASAL